MSPRLTAVAAACGGQVSQKEAHKNARDAKAAGKGSFAWAWALDQRPEVRSL